MFGKREKEDIVLLTIKNNMYKIKKCRHILKNKYNAKAYSKCRKNELNELILCCSNDAYLKRKTENYETVPQLILKLIYNESIRNHIMSYIVNRLYNMYLHDKGHFEITDEVKIFQLFRFSIQYTHYDIQEDDLYNKQTMLSIHTKLFNRNPYYDENVNNDNVYRRLKYIKNYCLYHLQDSCYIKNMPVKMTLDYYRRILLII